MFSAVMVGLVTNSKSSRVVMAGTSRLENQRLMLLQSLGVKAAENELDTWIQGGLLASHRAEKVQGVRMVVFDRLRDVNEIELTFIVPLQQKQRRIRGAAAQQQLRGFRRCTGCCILTGRHGPNGTVGT